MTAPLPRPFGRLKSKYFSNYHATHDGILKMQLLFTLVELDLAATLFASGTLNKSILWSARATKW